MSEGFVVVCEDDGILYGQGDTAADAIRDAEPWIEDAVRDFIRDEVRDAGQKGRSIFVDMTWRPHPATKGLRESLVERGGHDNWHRRTDGVLDLGRAPANPVDTADCDGPALGKPRCPTHCPYRHNLDGWCPDHAPHLEQGVNDRV